MVPVAAGMCFVLLIAAGDGGVVGWGVPCAAPVYAWRLDCVGVAGGVRTPAVGLVPAGGRGMPGRILPPILPP